MTHHCQHNHSKDCSQHSESFEDEFDPCMAKEIAQAEKHRIVYGKLKAQSDRMLMNLNIRTGKLRIRSCVASQEENLSSSSASDNETVSVRRILKVLPADLFKLCSSKPGSKIFSLAVPCDMTEEVWPTASMVSLVSKFEALNKSTLKSSDLDHFSILSKRICVCGKCEDSETRLVGSLRSIAMVLKKCPSIIVTRGGGLVGIWTAANPDYDDSMESFIRKNI